MTKLYFDINFEKGVAGKDNDNYNSDFPPECNDCGYDIQKGEEYWYWTYLENGEAVPTIDNDDYILCKKCKIKKSFRRKR